MKRITLLIMILLAGCSSKTQTNPLPDQKKYVFSKETPNTHNADFLEAQSEDFDKFAKSFFGNRNADMKKNIWQIGLDRFPR